MNRSTGTAAARPGRRPASGFSLMEMVLAVAIMSILMVAIASAMILAGKAVPTGQTTADRIAQSGTAGHRIIAELQAAVHITERGPSSIAFTVADRDGDGHLERIRYAWSGTAGDPLTRQYNGGSAVEVLTGVHDFTLTYDLKTVTESYRGPHVESAEQLLSSYDGADDLKEFKIEKSKWCGQYFKPTLPAEAVAWGVTRVLFKAKEENSDDDETFVQLRPPDANKTPTTIVLEQHVMSERDLTNDFVWKEFSFSNVGGLDVGSGFCLVLQHCGVGGPSAKVHYDDVVGPGRLDTADTGATWTYDSGRALKHYVYGTYSTRGAIQTATRQYVTAVRVALQVGEDTSSRVETSVRTVNVPQVLSAVWETGFDGDPRQADLNGDGGDWGESEAPFDPQTLSGGIWYAPNAASPNRVILRTLTDEDFVEPTTVEIRYRATSVGGSGVVFWANVDRTGTQCAPLYAVLSKPDAGSQHLRIGNRLPGGSIDWLAVHTGLPDNFVTLRLIVDTDAHTVAVFVDGAHKGTYGYTWGYSDTEQMAAIYAEGCSGEIDSVSIRVGTYGL